VAGSRRRRHDFYDVRRGNDRQPQFTRLVFAGIGLATLVYMLIGWFSTVSRESEHGDYNRKVDVSFRWG
jgi:hypothetical protein